MVNWFCSKAFGFSNCNNKNSNGKKFKCYHLPGENSEIQSQYKIIFRTDIFNWNDRQIYATHKRTGERKNIYDLSDIRILENQFQKI